MTTFWSGDAFNVCHSRLSSDVLFDVISTSNLIDHVGLLNLLVTCQRRLKKYVSLIVPCILSKFITIKYSASPHNPLTPTAVIWEQL